MELSFLGHQGWAFGNSDAGTVLLDPLIESMGRGRVRLNVWPHRTLVFNQSSNILAIYISHEHSDHFDIETLWALPFRCKVLISPYSSDGMERIIGSMGYSVERYAPFFTETFSGISITPLPTKYVRSERDVFGFMVSEKDGSFLTSVDSYLSEEANGWLKENCPERSADNYTNNAVSQCDSLNDDNLSYPNTERDFIKYVADNLHDFIKEYSPQNVLISGLGWSYPEPLERFNRIHFRANCELLARLGSSLYFGINFTAPAPGDRFLLNGNKCSRLENNSPYVKPLPTTISREWCSLESKRPYDIRSFVGVKSLAKNELSRLLRFVEEEYGRRIFCCAPDLVAGLYALQSIHGRSADGLVLKIRNATETYAYLLSARHACFDRLENSSEANDFSLGVEMWASDLAEIVQCREDAFVVYETSALRWNCFPSLFKEDILVELFECFSPLHERESWHASYQHRVALLLE